MIKDWCSINMPGINTGFLGDSIRIQLMENPFISLKCHRQHFKSNILSFLEGMSHQRYRVSLWCRCQMSGLERWQCTRSTEEAVAEGSCRINDAHRMFWVFSSWCVKGEQGLWDSRLGTPPREKQHRNGGRLRDSSDIHRTLHCLSLVWTVSEGRTGGRHIGAETHRGITYMNIL